MAKQDELPKQVKEALMKVAEAQLRSLNFFFDMEEVKRVEYLGRVRRLLSSELPPARGEWD